MYSYSNVLGEETKSEDEETEWVLIANENLNPGFPTQSQVRHQDVTFVCVLKYP